MKNVIVIVGPTATGKTEVAIRLARKIHGEIISADSRQIYKHLNIGTNKPTKKQLNYANRRILNGYYEKCGFEYLYKKLSAIDSETAKTIDRNNPIRVIRAL